jgi:hypothetical protein
MTEAYCAKTKDLQKAHLRRASALAPGSAVVFAPHDLTRSVSMSDPSVEASLDGLLI